MNEEKQKILQSISTEELALMMQQNYEIIIQAQASLIVLEKELLRRIALQKQISTEGIHNDRND